MTREQWAERLPVIQAWCEGKVVQSGRANGDPVWLDYTGREPLFGHHDLIWRIKPEPRKAWVNEYPGDLLSTWPSKREADLYAAVDRIACHEIELPPLP